MKIILSDEKLKNIDADSKVVLVVAKNYEHKSVKDSDVLSQMGFEGGEGESCYIQASKTLYVGIECLEPEEVRVAMATVVRFFRKMKVTELKMGAPVRSEGCPVTILKAIAEGAIMGDYDYDTYRTTKTSHPIQKITISLANTYETIESPLEAKTLQLYVDESIIVAEAVNDTRDLVNQAPDHFTPDVMAKTAKQWADENNMGCLIYDEHYLEQNGMGAFLAVSRASIHPPRLIHLSYTPTNPIATVFFVGKGLTYDSGGLSLKPGDYMVTMKADKAGACAVLGAMSALKALNCPIAVHGVLGMTENMIGGNAYKPDDILRAKNGKTIEVRNTDAEGRLVLADCLCYIQDYAKDNGIVFDSLVDLATLTGACVVGVGDYTIGVMGHNDALKTKIRKAATSAGEYTAELPFNKYLKKLIKSEVADVCNISSSRYGGAITAALFLSEFITDENKQKWVHLDIAGPAFVEKAWGYNSHGASGAGVRTLLKYIKHIELEKNGFFAEGHFSKG